VGVRVPGLQFTADPCKKVEQKHSEFCIPRGTEEGHLGDGGTPGRGGGVT